MSSKKPQRKTKLFQCVFLAIILAFFIFLGAGLGFVVGAIRNMPQYDLENITGDLSSIVLDKDNQEVTSLRSMKNRVELQPNQIPLIMKQAIIAIEDQRFYTHLGIDPWRLGGAVIANLTKGYGSQGASTITQQLAGVAVLENREKKMRRKIQEAILALRVETRYTKEQILAMYLNNIYYGHNAWSLETASQAYFGKKAQDVTLSEAAMLAGVVNAPSRYSPYLNMEKAKQRQAIVLSEMVKMGSITQEEAEKAKAEPFNLVGLKANTNSYQSFVDYIIEEAADALGMESTDIANLYTAGYKFYTTLDTKTQDAAELVYADDKNFPPNKGDTIIQSAMVILDPHSGEIRTLIGGRQQQGQREFNRAVDAYRQPGSVFKPVAVYGPALELGYSPATVLDDYLEEYDTPQGTKSFVNYDARYRGLISMRTALQYSINTVAVKMLQKIGVAEGLRFAKNLGITSLVESGKSNDTGLSLALGGLTKGVSPLELASAYGCFANEGIYIKPFAILKIEDKDGHVLYKHKTNRSIAMSPQTAYLMNDMLQTVVQSGTGTKAQLDRPVAGKTGTTSFDVDAWFVGYTPNLVGTVWLGFDKVESMKGVFGGSAGAPIWNQVMRVAHQGIPVTDFPQPEDIINIQVDYKSGLLPSSLTPSEFISNENFYLPNVPTEVSNVWVPLPVCADTGLLLTGSCPTPVTRIFLKRPLPWTGTVPPEDAKLEPPNAYCNLHGSGGFVNTGISLQGSTLTRNGTKQVKLSWYKHEATTTTVYQVYRSLQPNVTPTPNNHVSDIKTEETIWYDSNLPTAAKLYYRVVAQDSQTGEQMISNEISINLGEAIIPNLLKAPRLTGSSVIKGNKINVTLTWTKAIDSRPLVYYIYRADTHNFTPSALNQLITDGQVSTTTYTDTGLIRNKTYYYRVIAYDPATQQKSPISNQLLVQVN